MSSISELKLKEGVPPNEFVAHAHGIITRAVTSYNSRCIGKARVPNYHFTEESRELDLFFLTLQVLNLFSPLSVYLLR